jgi:hypothetical protein
MNSLRPLNVLGRSKRHPSEVYADALREYVGRDAPDDVTDALNAVLEKVGEEPKITGHSGCREARSV